MQRERKENKGITLIALVVTIIVLLILAGVSISMLTGENGILKRANKAKEETARATEDEQRKMAMFEAATNISGMEFQEVPIPAGFAPTRIQGESTVDEGLVITDSEGNEFVWIPCEYDSESVPEGVTNPVFYNEPTTKEGDDKLDNRNSEWRIHQYKYNGGTWGDEQPHTIGQNSIRKNHGFYIARYEAGVPENAKEFFVNEKSENLTYQDSVKKDAEDVENLSPVSKKNWQVWNFISQIKANEVAQNMVDNSSVKSYLIDSHAWNTVCRVIAKKDTSKNLTNSTDWGNYYDNITTKYEKLTGLYAIHQKNPNYKKADYYLKGTISSSDVPRNKGDKMLELATGMSEDFKAYNIYDLAGNMWEWTTETGTAPVDNNNNEKANCSEKTIEGKNAVSRGGGFDCIGINYPVTHAHFRDVDQYYVIGFRVVLYLK